MEKNLHPLQEKIYDLFKKNQNNLPSYRQIAKTIGVSSTNTVAYHIQKLKDSGYLISSNIKNGISPLTLRTILNLDAKSGVYAILKNKKPLLVSEADNLRLDILTHLAENSCLLTSIAENLEKTSVAYYIVENKNERKELKDYLVDLYKKQGAELC